LFRHLLIAAAGIVEKWKPSLGFHFSTIHAAAPIISLTKTDSRFTSFRIILKKQTQTKNNRLPEDD